MIAGFRSRKTRSRYSQVEWSAYFWTSVRKMKDSASRKTRSASARFAVSTLSKSGVSVRTRSRQDAPPWSFTSPGSPGARPLLDSWRRYTDRIVKGRRYPEGLGVPPASELKTLLFPTPVGPKKATRRGADGPSASLRSRFPRVSRSRPEGNERRRKPCGSLRRSIPSRIEGISSSTSFTERINAGAVSSGTPGRQSLPECPGGGKKRRCLVGSRSRESGAGTGTGTGAGAGAGGGAGRGHVDASRAGSESDDNEAMTRTSPSPRATLIALGHIAPRWQLLERAETARIEEWILDPSAPAALWIHGPPGSGRTTAAAAAIRRAAPAAGLSARRIVAHGDLVLEEAIDELGTLFRHLGSEQLELALAQRSLGRSKIAVLLESLREVPCILWIDDADRLA